jgi:hypothetical protein
MKIPKSYINKKLESSSIPTILKSDHHTAYRLYLITNNIKEVENFATIDSLDYNLIAYVKTECGFTGLARKQIWDIIHLQPLLKKIPRYTLQCELRHRMTNKVIYKCVFQHKNINVMYTQIQECIKQLNEILK